MVLKSADYRVCMIVRVSGALPCYLIGPFKRSPRPLASTHFLRTRLQYTMQGVGNHETRTCGDIPSFVAILSSLGFKFGVCIYSEIARDWSTVEGGERV